MVVQNCVRSTAAEIEMCGGGERGGGGGSEDEPYEDATPLHGDKLFHAFLTRLRKNPGQILRFILILSLEIGNRALIYLHFTFVSMKKSYRYAFLNKNI